MPFYFARHGQSKFDGPISFVQGRERGGLTGSGWRTVRTSAEFLRNISPSPSRIITSPAERARQTAQIIANELGLTVHTDKRLGPMAKGIYEGLPAESIKNELAYYGRNDTTPIPGGESYKSFRERIAPALREYAESEDTPLLVGHSDGLALFPWLAGFVPDPDYGFRLLNNGGVLWGEATGDGGLSYWALTGAIDDNLEVE